MYVMWMDASAVNVATITWRPHGWAIAGEGADLMIVAARPRAR